MSDEIINSGNIEIENAEDTVEVSHKIESDTLDATENIEARFQQCIMYECVCLPPPKLPPSSCGLAWTSATPRQMSALKRGTPTGVCVALLTRSVGSRSIDRAEILASGIAG